MILIDSGLTIICRRNSATEHWVSFISILKIVYGVNEQMPKFILSGVVMTLKVILGPSSRFWYDQSNLF